MSFAIPRNVPNLNSGQRAQEDRYWNAKYSSSSASEDFLIPTYKDKPYGSENINVGQRKKKKRLNSVVLILLGAAIFGMLWFTYNSNDRKDYDKLVSSEQRQKAIKDVFKRSWDGYEKYAWGYDVYKPISKTGENMGPKPLGWVIVDSLDTLAIMGLNSRLKKARSWVKNVLDYDMDYEVNTFETSIRMLGGLLSTYALTNDKLYLNKAKDLGDRITGAFNSESGIPFASVNLHTGRGIRSHTDRGASSTAEAATVQLEFKYLSHLTGEKKYWDISEKVLSVMDSNHPEGGLVPIYIQPDTGKFQGDLIRLGSRGDSYYEYLIKQYVQTNNQEPIYKEMYNEAVAGIKKYLLKQSEPNKLAFIAELEDGIDGPFSPKMDHLVCFIGGMLALGATDGHPVHVARRTHWTTLEENDLQLAMELTRTCYEMYAKTPTGLAPEIAFFNTKEDNNQDFRIKAMDAHNLQRPETVESLFVLWRLTKNPIYREWGWEIFKAFEKHTRIEGDAGYSSLESVKEVPPKFRDNMESFWLSETLKYLYLLFDDSEEELLPLHKYVFSTEAHPFPRFNSEFSTGWTRQPPTEAIDNDGFE